ncbi:MAG: hypothetical protein JSR66_28735 [Proteobacteria bacterium]|nr:hypothetical protein [Pseudomonadota bacterium]
MIRSRVKQPVRGRSVPAPAALLPGLLMLGVAHAAPTNLVADPQFDSGTSGFEAQDASSVVVQTAQAALEGANSLSVSINGWGNNVWWEDDEFAGGTASAFAISAHVASVTQSSSALDFCAMAYYADGSDASQCTTLSGQVGDKGTVSVLLPLDSTKPLATIDIRLSQDGGQAVGFLLDDAVANLTVVQAPPAGGGSGGTGGGDGTGGGSGGGGSGGGAPSACTVLPPGQSAYPGFTYNLPQNRPFISVASYAQVSQSSTAFARFKAGADAALRGDPPYGYSAMQSVIMFKITGNVAYINDAISRVEAMVTAAENAAASGGVPEIAGDSYLDVGPEMEELALTYDYAFDRLSSAQQQRWAAFAEQTLQNVWNPDSASWGGVPHAWSGWAVCDPGDNYYYSFMRATMLWALASKSTTWLSFLQTNKFPLLIDYYANLPGGGTREGTGYGTALHNLFENYIYWKDSTGEDLASLTPHTRETIDYWVNATVPTLDRFAPIGDQSRSSIPDLYDYHENLVHEAVVLSRGTAQAQRGTWWLNNNSVNGVSQASNVYGDLLPLPATPLQPTALVYQATGAGVLFARSGWSTDASWISFVAGKYDQSHAHQDQGAFTFFKNDWLAVTQNIWSHSGIHQEVIYTNGLRFERADGSVVPEAQSDTVQSTMSYTNTGGTVAVAADLSNAYSANSASVQSWTRNLQFSGDTLRVTDACSVASGVRAVFQVQVPVQPVTQQDGSVVAGHLHIVPLKPVTMTSTPLPSDEFSQGYRLDFTTTSGCAFDFNLFAQ